MPAKTDKWKTVKPVVERKIKNGWSSSRYTVYDQCPAKAAYKFIDKLPEPPAPALDRGSLIHKQAELFIRGRPTPVVDEDGPFVPPNREGILPDGTPMHKAGVPPPQLARFADMFNDAVVRAKRVAQAVTVEDTWAFTKDWVLCSSTDWDHCWLRVKVDYAYESKGDVLIIKDWKTGRYDKAMHDDYLKTLQLYALGGLLKFPHIRKVHPGLVYLDAGLEYPNLSEELLEYTRADVPKLKKLWEERVKPMFADRKFAPKPNAKCCWCAYSKAKGGPCRF